MQKKIRLEIAEAFKNLKDIDFPQFYSFAPSTATSVEGFYRNNNEAKKLENDGEKIRAANEKRKALKAEEKLNNRRTKNQTADSIRQHYIARGGTTRAPHNEIPGFPTFTEATHYIVIDGTQIAYVKGIKTPSASVSDMVLPNAESSSNFYVSTDGEDECEKANKNKSSRRVISTVTVHNRGTKTTSAKPKKTASITINKNCVAAPNKGVVSIDAKSFEFEF